MCVYIQPFHMYVYTLTNMHQFRKIYNIIIHILHIMLSTYMNTYTHVHVQTFKWGANFTSMFSDNVKSNAHFLTSLNHAISLTSYRGLLVMVLTILVLTSSNITGIAPRWSVWDFHHVGSIALRPKPLCIGKKNIV
jgi:ABC-type xylose transport system permease subunit